MKPFKAALAAIMVMMLAPDIPAQPSTDATQYLIIVADMQWPAFLSPGRIYISVDGQQYIVKKVPASKVKDKYDYSYLIRMIKKYNREGWKLLNGDLSVVAEKNSQQGRIFIMMKRENPYGIDRTPIDTIYQGSSKNPSSEGIKDGVPQKR
ncbi:MAG: hypothetical protein KGY60_06295 [Bacteroidales bacterium]|nr:hypothetical protein [Bacteroidales bacterium]